MKATFRLIDSVWTVEYEMVDAKNVRILTVGRKDKEGYEKEKELPRCNLVENSERTVIAFVVSPYAAFRYGASLSYPDSKLFEVVNQKHIFDY